MWVPVRCKRVAQNSVQFNNLSHRKLFFELTTAKENVMVSSMISTIKFESIAYRYTEFMLDLNYLPISLAPKSPVRSPAVTTGTKNSYPAKLHRSAHSQQSSARLRTTLRVSCDARSWHPISSRRSWTVASRPNSHSIDSSIVCQSTGLISVNCSGSNRSLIAPNKFPVMSK